MFSIFSALSLSSTRLRDFGFMRHTAMTAILCFCYQRTRMSGMIMASPEVVTSSTSQGSSSTAMSLWHKPSISKTLGGSFPTSFPHYQRIAEKAVKAKGNSFSDIVEKPLSHPALRQYLRERGILVDGASRFYCQVEYRYNDKQFFAVGFKNNSDGYEIRNHFFKGCVSPKDITLIGRNSNVCHLYEGFIDFLSAVILGIGRGENHIILNSVANIQKVHHLLDGYAQVYCHLDNDEAGENACVELQKRYGDKIIDHSHLYTGYKDLNEYLMSHKTRK